MHIHYTHTYYIQIKQENNEEKVKSWLFIQRLNENNLIDAGSTEPTWTSMWLPLFNGLFDGCE